MAAVVRKVEDAIHLAGSRRARVRSVADDGTERRFEVAIRIDTPQETDYCRHSGILQYVWRQLAQPMFATRAAKLPIIVGAWSSGDSAGAWSLGPKGTT